MKFECNLLYLSLFVVVAKSILILFVASVPIYFILGTVAKH